MMRKQAGYTVFRQLLMLILVFWFYILNNLVNILYNHDSEISDIHKTLTFTNAFNWKK